MDSEILRKLGATPPPPTRETRSARELQSLIGGLELALSVPPGPKSFNIRELRARLDILEKLACEREAAKQKNAASAAPPLLRGLPLAAAAVRISGSVPRKSPVGLTGRERFKASIKLEGKS